MFFLNEKLLAAFLSIVAFFGSFVTSLIFSVSVRTALLRSVGFAFIFMFIGLIFGSVMKNIIVEAYEEREKKRLEAEAKKAEEENSENEAEETRRIPRV